MRPHIRHLRHASWNPIPANPASSKRVMEPGIAWELPLRILIRSRLIPPCRSLSLGKALDPGLVVMIDRPAVRRFNASVCLFRDCRHR